jgi:phage FluMu protein Com
MLFKIERNALRGSKVIEVKCAKCNALNYSVGDGGEAAA